MTSPRSSGSVHGRIVIYGLRLLVCRRTGRINGQLTLAALVKADEPIRRLIYCLSHAQQSVVLQNADLVLALKHAGNLLAFVGRQHDAPVVTEDGVGSVETERVLHEGRQRLAKCRIRLAIDGVGVAYRVDPWMGLVDFRVNGKSSSINSMLATEDLGVFVDAY